MSRYSLIVPDQSVVDDIVQLDSEQIRTGLLQPVGTGLKFDRTEQPFVVFALYGFVGKCVGFDLLVGLIVLFGQAPAVVHDLLDLGLQLLHRQLVVQFGDGHVVAGPGSLRSDSSAC